MFFKRRFGDVVGSDIERVPVGQYEAGRFGTCKRQEDFELSVDVGNGSRIKRAHRGEFAFAKRSVNCAKTIGVEENAVPVDLGKGRIGAGGSRLQVMLADQSNERLSIRGMRV